MPAHDAAAYAGNEMLVRPSAGLRRSNNTIFAPWQTWKQGRGAGHSVECIEWEQRAEARQQHKQPKAYSPAAPPHSRLRGGTRAPPPGPRSRAQPPASSGTPPAVSPQGAVRRSETPGTLRLRRASTPPTQAPCPPTGRRPRRRQASTRSPGIATLWRRHTPPQTRRGRPSRSPRPQCPPLPARMHGCRWAFGRFAQPGHAQVACSVRADGYQLLLRTRISETYTPVCAVTTNKDLGNIYISICCYYEQGSRKHIHQYLLLLRTRISGTFPEAVRPLGTAHPGPGLPADPSRTSQGDIAEEWTHLRPGSPIEQSPRGAGSEVVLDLTRVCTRTPGIVMDLWCSKAGCITGHMPLGEGFRGGEGRGFD
eukprot:355463-Chlamydomonas_euryale.AAC.2